MKFSCSVTINKPKEHVIKYFMNTEYLKEYQEGFLKKELISGPEQEEGSIAKLYYKMGKGHMELTETVIENKLPDYFYAQYYHKHTENTMKTHFKEISDNATQLTSEIHYTAFKGFMIKTLAFLFPGMFKKQVQKWLNNLKTFAESQA